MEPVILEIESFLVAVGDNDLVHHPKPLKQDALVVIWDRRLATFVMLKDFGRSKRDDQIVSKRAGLLEELEVSGMEDVVAAGNEDFLHQQVLNG